MGPVVMDLHGRHKAVGTLLELAVVVGPAPATAVVGPGPGVGSVAVDPFGSVEVPAADAVVPAAAAVVPAAAVEVPAAAVVVPSAAVIIPAAAVVFPASNPVAAAVVEGIEAAVGTVGLPPTQLKDRSIATQVRLV